METIQEQPKLSVGQIYYRKLKENPEKMAEYVAYHKNKSKVRYENDAEFRAKVIARGKAHHNKLKQEAEAYKLLKQKMEITGTN